MAKLKGILCYPNVGPPKKQIKIQTTVFPIGEFRKEEMGY
jgi:hypothetical protein